MSTEAEVAAALAHRDRVGQILARTGGEMMHPDHYDLREAIRVAVLHALDDVATDRGIGKASDAELPALFRTLDAITQRMFLASVGIA